MVIPKQRHPGDRDDGEFRTVGSRDLLSTRLTEADEEDEEEELTARNWRQT